MNARDEFINSGDFDHDEALKAAVDKRKFLLKRLLKGIQLLRTKMPTIMSII